MIFFIADTFQAALAKLDNQSQKAAKICALDLQMDPGGTGKQFHRIDGSREKNFWSVRANRDVRIIVHKTADRLTLCYVDHHDAAYDWAERRVFERHPATGALQVVELIERVEEVAAPTMDLVEAARTPAPSPPSPPALGHLGADDLLAHGVPPSWTERLLAASEEDAYALTDHLPGEAAEAVLAFLLGEAPPAPQTAAEEEEQRRFRVVEHVEELEAALDYPWDKWTVFLHPSQRRIVDAEYSGPARVAGSAGTGKTVVALHRAVKMADRPGARVLLTTFSRPLANALQRKVGILRGDEQGLAPNINVASFLDAACELYELKFGRKPVIAKPDRIAKAFVDVAPDEDQTFLLSEWHDVVDGWQVQTLQKYMDTPRTGRQSRISKGQRERYWPLFEHVRDAIRASGRLTEAMVFDAVARAHADAEEKPFSHIIVDEAQDLGVAELRFLSAIAANKPDALFFAGDLGQRIFKLPFSWSSIGINVRGRSSTLKVNYRTSHQVRSTADRLLPDELSDMDGVGDTRLDTVSVFNGPQPHVHKSASEKEELEAAAHWVDARLSDGLKPREIAIIVRDPALLPRARAVAEHAACDIQTLTESLSPVDERICIGTMHLAKGLEFRAVCVIACDDAWLPLESRIETAATHRDLEEIYTTERHLLYVACTRAREWLWVSGVNPVSDYLADFEATA